MSWTEINHERAGRHGGMPYDAILYKLEETDPELVDGVRGRDAFHDDEDDYNNYVRGEIIDRAPDPPLLEEDHARRDPALSRSALNLRYNGTRGSSPELPRHPELFIGFTGNDPRGVDNNPRFDVMRGHISARAANLEARMGNNDDNHVAERPWTNQSLSYAKKEVHRRLKHNTKIFTPQKEGRPFGRNVVTDDLVFGAMRRAQTNGGDEGIFAEGARFATGDSGAAAAEGGAPARRFVPGGVGDANRRLIAAPGHLGAMLAAAARPGGTAATLARAADAPWRRATHDGDLAVQRYGPAPRHGAARSDAARAASHSTPDQDATDVTVGRAVSRHTLAATLGRAASAAAAPWGARPDADHGEHYVAGRKGKSTPHPEDIARLAHATAPDHHVASAVTQLVSIAAAARGLRAGTAGEHRRTLGAGLAAGARPDLAAEGVNRGLGAPGDAPAMARLQASLSPAGLAAAAAAGELQVQNYRGVAGPGAPDAARREGRTAGRWGRPWANGAVGKSATQAFRGNTQDPVALGDEAERVFGGEGVVASRSVAALSRGMRNHEESEDLAERDSNGLAAGA